MRCSVLATAVVCAVASPSSPSAPPPASHAAACTALSASAAFSDNAFLPLFPPPAFFPTTVHSSPIIRGREETALTNLDPRALLGENPPWGTTGYRKMAPRATLTLAEDGSAAVPFDTLLALLAAPHPRYPHALVIPHPAPIPLHESRPYSIECSTLRGTPHFHHRARSMSKGRFGGLARTSCSLHALYALKCSSQLFLSPRFFSKPAHTATNFTVASSRAAIRNPTNPSWTESRSASEHRRTHISGTSRSARRTSTAPC